MKKLFLLFALVGVTANAQFNEVSTDCETIGELITNTKIIKCGEVYTFYYKDTKFQQVEDIKHFSFTDSEYLYDYLISHLDDKFKGKKTLEFEDGLLTLTFKRYFGTGSVSIAYTSNAGVTGTSEYLTKGKIKKLFNK